MPLSTPGGGWRLGECVMETLDMGGLVGVKLERERGWNCRALARRGWL